MSIPVEVNIANADPNEVWATVQAALDSLRSKITAEITAAFTPYVKGSATPSVDDQDKVWHKQDSAGRPLGTFLFYNGAWRKEYDGTGGSLKVFFGDPTLYFDGTGLGIVGGFYDGWALMNGQNGTADLSDKFIIAGHMNNVGTTGYDGGWRTVVNGVPEIVGGVASITLDTDNTFRPPIEEVTVGKWTADGLAVDGAGTAYGSVGDGSHPETTLIEADAGNPTPDAIPTVPPFYAMSYIQFVGYA